MGGSLCCGVPVPINLGRYWRATQRRHTLNHRLFQRRLLRAMEQVARTAAVTGAEPGDNLERRLQVASQRTLKRLFSMPDDGVSGFTQVHQVVEMPMGAVVGPKMAADPGLHSRLSRAYIAVPTALEIKLTSPSYRHRYVLGQLEYQDVDS